MILAILQARLSSTRLPGKVLLPLAGAPMLLRQIERTARARRIDQIVVATSVEASDDPTLTVRRKRDPGPNFPWERVLAACGLERLKP